MGECLEIIVTHMLPREYLRNKVVIKDSKNSAPGKDRTCDTRIRNPVLYPLSYGGMRLN